MVVRYKSGELINKWVVLHLRIDSVSGCFFSLNGVKLLMDAFGDISPIYAGAGSHCAPPPPPMLVFLA